MIFRLFRPSARPATIAALYGVIVAQARRPIFYADFGAPDTAEGRFDLIVLHLALLCRRLADDGADSTAHSLSQGVFDMFCRDMDHNLREMGVGDLSVPKTMRKLGEAFYGRLDVYNRALAAEAEDDLVAALVRNVLGGASAGGPRLAAYARAAAQCLDETPLAHLREGHLAFPDPNAFAAGATEVGT